MASNSMTDCMGEKIWKLFLPSLFDSIFSLLQRGTYDERRNSFQIFSPMQSVIELDAIHVGEGVIQQQELRLYMLSKVPCGPAIGGPEHREGSLLGEEVQEA